MKNFWLVLVVIMLNFASIPGAKAAWCLFWCANADIAGEIKFPNPSEFKGMGKDLGESLREELEKTKFKEIGQQLSEGFSQEFEKTMTTLIDEKITPLVKDINKLLKARIEQVDKLVEKRLQQIDAMIEKTFHQFQAVADKTIEKIKLDLIDNTFTQFNQAIEKTKMDIIDNTFFQLNELRSNFRTDVDHFFNRTEYLIDKVDCKVEGTLEKLRQDLQSTGKEIAQELQKSLPNFSLLATKKPNKPAIPSELVACYQQLGLNAPPEPFEYSTIYDLKKCKVLRTIKSDTPVRRILNIYIDLQAFAARMACVQRGAGHRATLHYTWDWIEFGYQYDFWHAYNELM